MRLVLVARVMLVLFVVLSWGVTEAEALEPVSTLRLDFVHTGNAEQEFFSVHEWVIEPTPWPGNPDRVIDDTNRGKYLFEVVDPDNDQVLYSRGFSSIYGEWETTAEAKRINRSFHESLRFPLPDQAVRVDVSKRNEQNKFTKLWSIEVDPEDILIRRAHQPRPAPVLTIEENGNPAHKVDLLILGDGYTAEEADKFEADARRLTAAFFEVSPFKERRQDFNVWAMAPPSSESGVARPSVGEFKWSPLGTRYDAFRSRRYVLTFENKAFREIASFAPYDAVEILVNNETYGGGGIFGLYSTAAVDSGWADYVFIHEFGHHFADLADEYYTSPVAYEPTPIEIEPWSPNVTALLDPAQLKWGHLVGESTPVPTTWPKDEYEEFARAKQAEREQMRIEQRPESELNELFQRVQEFSDDLFSRQQYNNTVGAFEGANYEAEGYYRPEMNCLMFTRHDKFCHVCSDAIEEIIDLYVGSEK